MKKFLATICAVALLMADCGQFVETTKRAIEEASK